LGEKLFLTEGERGEKKEGRVKLDQAGVISDVVDRGKEKGVGKKKKGKTQISTAGTKILDRIAGRGKRKREGHHHKRPLSFCGGKRQKRIKATVWSARNCQKEDKAEERRTPEVSKETIKGEAQRRPRWDNGS